MTTEHQANRRRWRVGEIVLYSPDSRHAFGCIVESEPWPIGDGSRYVTTVYALGPEYQSHVGCPGRTRSAGIYCGALQPAPTEYALGTWRLADDPEPGDDPAGVIVYASEPSPETGHVGWCWWARGRMGDAPSYEAARAEVERVCDLYERIELEVVE